MVSGGEGSSELARRISIASLVNRSSSRTCRPAQRVSLQVTAAEREQEPEYLQHGSASNVHSGFVESGVGLTFGDGPGYGSPQSIPDSTCSNLPTAMEVHHILPERPNIGTKARRGRRHRCLYAGCGREFTRLSNLKAHGRKHTGAEPYACLNCHRRFKWRSSLKSHENGCTKQQHVAERHVEHSMGRTSSDLSCPVQRQQPSSCSVPYRAEHAILSSVPRQEPFACYTLPSIRLAQEGIYENAPKMNLYQCRSPES